MIWLFLDIPEAPAGCWKFEKLELGDSQSGLGVFMRKEGQHLTLSHLEVRAVVKGGKWAHFTDKATEAHCG